MKSTLLLLAVLTAGCFAMRPAPNSGAVVGALRSLPLDLERDGPTAWLSWFEPTPDFRMAAYGGLEFDGYAAAVERVRSLATIVRRVELELATPRVTPLGPGLSAVGVAYRQRLEFTDRPTLVEQGYLSGVLRESEHRWRFVELHWSTPQVPADGL